MSYARFSGADVYVFLSVDGHLECCGCSLCDDWRYITTDAMLAHLAEHRRAGHDVPDSCLEGLEEDRADNDRFIQWTAKHGLVFRFSKPYGQKVPATPENPFGFEHFFTVVGWGPKGPIVDRADKPVD